MIEYSVNLIDSNYHFKIKGVSYIGNPKENISRKSSIWKSGPKPVEVIENGISRLKATVSIA